MGKILVTYVTKTGSTKEAAEEIGAVLTENGLDADVRPISEVRELGLYAGAVIGAPINGMNWHPEAVTFVQTYRSVLNKIPTANFFLSYVLFQGSEYWRKKIRTCLDKVNGEDKPFSIGMFGGKLPGPLPPPIRLLFGVKKGSPADLRDNDAVRAWAKELLIHFV